MGSARLVSPQSLWDHSQGFSSQGAGSIGRPAGTSKGTAQLVSPQRNFSSPVFFLSEYSAQPNVSDRTNNDDLIFRRNNYRCNSDSVDNWSVPLGSPPSLDALSLGLETEQGYQGIHQMKPLPTFGQFRADHHYDRSAPGNRPAISNSGLIQPLQPLFPLRPLVSGAETPNAQFHLCHNNYDTRMIHWLKAHPTCSVNDYHAISDGSIVLPRISNPPGPPVGPNNQGTGDDRYRLNLAARNHQYQGQGHNSRSPRPQPDPKGYFDIRQWSPSFYGDEHINLAPTATETRGQVWVDQAQKVATRIAAMIKTYVGTAMVNHSCHGPKYPVVRVSPPDKYAGDKDYHQFEVWIGRLLRWMQINHLGGPERKHERVIHAGMALSGKAAGWYMDTVDRPTDRSWKLLDVFMGLYLQYIHETAIYEATSNFYQIQFSTAVDQYYRELESAASRMIQRPDVYTFKCKFLSDLPADIRDGVFDRDCGPEHSSVRELYSAAVQSENSLNLVDQFDAMEISTESRSEKLVFESNSESDSDSRSHRSSNKDVSVHSNNRPQSPRTQ
ncbi:hypothetical protein C8J56DRAFT_1042676 [Mycena floridula]|nr:hypothetical protein C8J56DRAFT_1042676 [Mycena floridula]